MEKKTRGYVNQVRGGTNELRFFQAIQSPSWSKPSWYRSVRRATQDEDSRGIDAIAQTDIGSIEIQIKSSFSGLAEHQKQHGNDQVIIVVSDHLGICEIQRRFVREVSRKRQSVLQQRR